MAMAMLSAGGLEVVEDGIRTADESNPLGYFELERVKELDKAADKTWLAGARGKAIKIVSVLLPHLPGTNNYQVIFMHRALDEVIASQNRMLNARREPAGRLDDEAVAMRYRAHLDQVRRFMSVQNSFAVLDVDYANVLSRPLEQAERIGRFLGGRLDIARMAAAVDVTLHRNRTATASHDD